MPTDEFATTFTVTAPAKEVYAHLIDPFRARLTATVDLADLAEGTAITDTTPRSRPFPR